MKYFNYGILFHKIYNMNNFLPMYVNIYTHDFLTDLSDYICALNFFEQFVDKISGEDIIEYSVNTCSHVYAHLS